MFEIIIFIYIISLIYIFFDVLHIKNSIGEAFAYLLGAILLWIIVFPYWVFYERKRIIEKEKKLNNGGEKINDEEEKEKIICSDCGEEIKEDTKFCPNCGADFEEDNKCSKCHHVNKENANFCEECGNKLR